MLPASSRKSGRSVAVTMHLLIDGTALTIAQMGPDFLMLRSDIAHPPTEAAIRLCMDASEQQWRVYLPEGVAAGGPQRVKIALPDRQEQRQKRSVGQR